MKGCHPLEHKGQKADAAMGSSSMFGSILDPKAIQDPSEELVWNNKNLKYVFLRLFQLSIEFPSQMSDQYFKDLPILQKNEAIKLEPKLKK